MSPEGPGAKVGPLTGSLWYGCISLKGIWRLLFLFFLSPPWDEVSGFCPAVKCYLVTTQNNKANPA